MSQETYTYPFDPTGQAVTNKIVGEQHIVNPPDIDREFYFAVPKQAPYFRDSLIVKLHNGTGTVELHEGIDYTVSHHFLSATRACAKPVNGSITFLSRDIAGVIELDYQTIGGMWTLDADKIMEILADRLLNPRITTWEEVVELPIAFPPIDHEWDLVDLVGMSEVVDAIDEVAAAILEAAGGVSQSHLNDTTNPHKVTQTQVGLGLVENFPMASVSQAVTGSSTAAYISPYTLNQAIRAVNSLDAENHMANASNPHGVTKVQVGLGNVVNFGVADQGEAEDGTGNDKYMTPQRVAQAIVVQITNQFHSHRDDTTNPHSVTKAQVGLSLVENYAKADDTIALAGSSDAHYMTPLKTKLLVGQEAGFEVAKHALNYNNPHKVGKTDVALGNVENYPIATEVLASEGQVNNHYMTPLRTKQAIAALVGDSLIVHMNDNKNPHGVTKDQVGLSQVLNYGVASQAEAVVGLDNSSYMTPLRTKEAIAALASVEVSEHIADKSNPHAVTKDQVGLANVSNYPLATSQEALNGISLSRYMSPGRVKEFVVAYVAGLGIIGDDTTVEDLGGMKTEDIAAALEGKIDKGEGIVQLGGMTVAQIESRLADKHDTTVVVTDIGGYNTKQIDDKLATKMLGTTTIHDLNGMLASEIMEELDLKWDKSTTVIDHGGMSVDQLTTLFATKMDINNNIGDLGGLTEAAIMVLLTNLENSTQDQLDKKMASSEDVVSLGGLTATTINGLLAVLRSDMNNGLATKMAGSTTIKDLNGDTTAEIDGKFAALEASLGNDIGLAIPKSDRINIITEATELAGDARWVEIEALRTDLMPLIDARIHQDDRPIILSEAATAATAYTDAEIITLKAYVNARDAATLTSAKDYADSLNSDQDSALTSAISTLRGEMSTGNSTTLSSAKSYADAEDAKGLSAAKAHAVAEDVKGLAAAEVYADAQDAKVLTNAKNYADAEDAKTLSSANTAAASGDATTLTSAKNFATAEDVKILSQAKSYADTRDGVTLASAKSYADTEDAKTLASAKAYADSIGSGSTGDANDYADAQDVVTLAAAKSHANTQDAVTLASAKSHSNTGDTNTLNSAKSYADAEDAKTLAAAKSYADSITPDLSDAYDYADAQDVKILTNAKTYADTQDAKVLTNAKNYADAEDAKTLTAAASAASSGDATTLASAKSYANSQDATTLASAKAYADTEDDKTLVAAKAYADSINPDLTDAYNYADNKDVVVLASAKTYSDTLVDALADAFNAAADDL